MTGPATGTLQMPPGRLNIGRLFNLHRGEGRRAALLFTYLFLVITAYLLGKTARDALFLSAFKASKLPYADMAIAVSVGFVVAIYVAIGRRAQLRDLLVGCLLVFAVLQGGFWYLAKFQPQWSWQYPVFYIWVGIFGVLAPAQVWTLANFLLTTREAKRVFGLVGAGGISGWIVSGLLADRLAKIKGLGVESLLLVMGLLLGACAILVILLWRERARALGPDESPHAEPASKSLRESLRVIVSSPYLVSISSLIVLASLATCFAGWQFKAIAKSAYPDKNALTAFFGQFNFWAGVVCLILQLTVTSRFLRRFGLGPALLVVPLTVFSSELGVLFIGTLTTAILLKSTDAVLRYSLDKSSVELLFLPIPAEVKLQAKSAIDTIIWRMGDGLSGLALAIFTDHFHWSAQRVSWINLVFAAAWICAAVLARRRYGAMLLQSIRQRRLDAEKQLAPVIDRSTADILASQLTSGDPRQVLYALDMFGVSQSPAAHPGVRALLDHADPAVRRRALELLDASGDLWVLPHIEEMLRDPDGEVRSAALLFLSHHTQQDPLTRIADLGSFGDVSVASGIVSFLAQAGDQERLPEAQLLMDRMIAEHGEDGRQSRLEAASMIGRLPDAFESQLETLLSDEDPEVTRAAVRSAGKLRKRKTAPRLIELLADPNVREEAVTAIASMGDRVLGVLRDQLLDEDAPRASRIEIPAVLARLGSQGAANALTENLLESDPELRFRTIWALNELRGAAPKTTIDHARLQAALGFEMMLHTRTAQIAQVAGRQAGGAPPESETDEVVRRLEAAHDQEIERIFRILSLLYPDTDFRSAHYGLRSGDTSARDNALEFLEINIDGGLRKTLVSLLDPTAPPDEQILPALRRTGAAAPRPGDLAAALVASDDPWLKACGLRSIGVLGLFELSVHVESSLDAEDALLRETARAAKKQLAQRRA